MTRKNAKNYPLGIDPKKLPAKCYWKKSPTAVVGYWYTKDRINGKQVSRRIAGPNATMSELWAIMANESCEIETQSIEWLAQEYMKGERYQNLATKTQESYMWSLKRLRKTKTAIEGVSVAQSNRHAWDTQMIQRMIDTFKKTPTAAHHTCSYLRLLYNWGLLRGFVDRNPVLKTMELPAKRLRQRLPTPDVVALIKKEAQRRSKLKSNAKGATMAYVYYSLEIAYLLRLRGIEVITLVDADVLENGVDVTRTKGSEGNITTWDADGRLRSVIHEAQQTRDAFWKKKRMVTPLDAKKRPIVIGQNGRQVTSSAWQDAWKGLLINLTKEGIITKEQWFGLHDMKRRGITDTKGTKSSKLDATGHSSIQQLNVYDKSKIEVPPSGY